jgi:hypothetical protein
MEDWLNELADTLGVDRLDQGTQDDLLDVAHDVAHAIERRATPLAVFLLGAAVERRRSGGESTEDALDGILADVRTTLPA